ncbi:MAG: hypothetical protein WA705_21280 [Candidatus Ozemobacteraceae bacterium]
MRLKYSRIVSGDKSAKESGAVLRAIIDVEKRIALAKAKELADFIRKFPSSRYADDALLILTEDLISYSSPDLSVATVNELFKTIATDTFHIEDFSLLENTNLAKAQLFIEMGKIEEYLLGTYAIAYAKNNEGEPSGKLAEKVLAALKDFAPTSPDLKGQAVLELKETMKILLPAEFSFRNGVAKALDDFATGELARAEEILEKVIGGKEKSSDLAVRNQDIADALFLLGQVRASNGKFSKARETFEKMIALSSPGLGFLNSKSLMLEVSPDIALAQTAVCYMKERNIDEGLEVGLKALANLEKNLPGNIQVLSNVHYNVACAYALKGDSTNALDHIKKSLDYDSSLKSTITNDPDFKSLAANPRFKELVK